ncbi:MAG: glucoamylase [Gammaproteobacteria bacterium]|nr:MAG: glucoamylase [Gammaproteobacteria bacterium]
MTDDPASRVQDLDLALIGNGSISALIDRWGDVVWMCVPRFDGMPVFNRLLRHPPDDASDPLFAFRMQDAARSEQRYIDNTAVLVTRLWDTVGNAVEITDFMPRFFHYGRKFRPITLVRMIRPLSGTPRLRVLLRPANDWAGRPAPCTWGSHHVSYGIDAYPMRLTTDLSVNAVLSGRQFVLDRPHVFILGPDESLRGPIDGTAREFYEQTLGYWREWVRALHIPFEWQDDVIRAAITLKLSAYEDTGAVVAAMTTSIPEAPDSGRNWDYRYCWLRDAYFTINALNRLGKTTTMEGYLSYLINLVANSQGDGLQPVYTLDGLPHLDEEIVSALPGYRGMGPVRVGNQAYLQRQNDVYGSVVLAAAHAFFDRRLIHPAGSESALFKMLENMGEHAWRVWNTPDAGIWEFRNTEQVHTYSALVCWAACDRLARIARHLGHTERAEHWRGRARVIHEAICERAWNEKLGCFTESFGGDHLDASVLLMNELGFLPATDPRFVATVDAVGRELRRGDFIFRYAKHDDFGEPETAFLVCTFWYVNALAAIGRRDEARDLFNRVLACRNRHGLFSEDIDPRDKTLWGNFPQTYSMVGLIQSAMRLSQEWEEAF